MNRCEIDLVIALFGIVAVARSRTEMRDPHAFQSDRVFYVHVQVQFVHSACRLEITDSTIVSALHALVGYDLRQPGHHGRTLQRVIRHLPKGLVSVEMGHLVYGPAEVQLMTLR